MTWKNFSANFFNPVLSFRGDRVHRDRALTAPGGYYLSRDGLRVYLGHENKPRLLGSKKEHENRGRKGARPKGCRE